MNTNSSSASPLRQPADRWVVMAFLILLNACTVGQMGVMSIFIEPIEAEYHLSDAAVTLLINVVYALVAIGASIPFGIATDKGNRRTLLTLSSVFFGLMFALPGWGSSALILLLSRIGVGIGHAGNSPLTISLLADKFAPARRPMAMTLVTIGSSIGAGVCITGGGYMAAAFGWRTAVQVIGFVTVAAAIAAYVFIREPKRGQLDDPSVVEAEAPSTTFRDTLRICLTQRSALHAIIGVTLAMFWGYGLAWWIPSYLNRSFGVSIGDAGAMLGPIHGIVGAGAVLLASALFVRLGEGDARKPLWFLAGLGAISTAPSVALVFANSAGFVILMTWLFLPMVYVALGPAFAIISAVVPPNMRGQANAIANGLVLAFSLAVAPLVIGVISDLVAPHIPNPAESLRYALFPLALTGLWAALHFWLASRHIRGDLARLATGLTGETAAPAAAPASAQ